MYFCFSIDDDIIVYLIDQHVKITYIKTNNIAVFITVIIIFLKPIDTNCVKDDFMCNGNY